MLAATSPHAPTGTQTITRSASVTASALVAAMWSASLSSTARSRTCGDASVATDSAARPSCLTARTIDEPIRPSPMTVTRANCGALFTLFPPHEFGERFDHEAIGFLGADGHAQRMRQLVVLQRPQDQSALGEERIRIVGRLACVLREV